MSKILIDEAAVSQALQGLEEFCETQTMFRPLERMKALRQALADAALDKMKENARELGLSYEQPAQQDIPDLIAGALGVSRGTAYDMMREALAEQSAQQEPVGYWQGKFSKDGGATLCRVPQVSFLGRHTYPNIPLYSTPPAPAQEPDPDELTIAYLNGIDTGKKRKPWVGLTDEEIAELKILPGANRERTATEMAFAVRDKLMEKNT